MNRKPKPKGTPENSVWLAGLGALTVAEQEGNDLFQQLVRKGLDAERDHLIEMRDVSTGKIVRVRVTAEILRKWTSLRRRRHFSSQVFLPEGPEEGGLSKEMVGTEESIFRSFLSSNQGLREVQARQRRRLAAAQRAFLKEFGSFDKTGVDWERLQSEHKIFTVTHRGTTYVPSFQFDEKGKPRPAVARVIQILGKDSSDWGLALWFTAASGRLDGKRPVDLLSSHPKEVVQAAEQEAAELVF